MDSPASEAARIAEDTLTRIALPKLESLEPEQISAAAAALALAAAKTRAAEAAIVQIRAAQMEKERRLQVVLDALTQVGGVMSAWCVNYNEDLSGAVGTMEFPGYLGGGVNIGFNGGGGGGRLRLSEAMTDAGVFYNAAMEPGHLKWRPLWRYGVITTKTGDSCNVTLEVADPRYLDKREPDMLLDEQRNLFNVPIQYPPCNGEVFEEGDAVVVVFIGLDREDPVVVGFKSNPKECLQRKSWKQLR